MAYLGECAALTVVLSWSICAILFEYSSKRVGASAINFLKLSLSFLVIGIYFYLSSGSFWAIGTTPEVWLWIGSSGIVGFALCDQALLSSYRLIGARYTQLILSTYPFFAALSAYVLLGESLSVLSLLGMVVITLGVVLSMSARNANGASIQTKFPIQGVLLAAFASVAQGIGFALSKKGMLVYEQSIATQPELLDHLALGASQIRSFVGFLAVLVMIVLGRNTKRVISAFSDKKAMGMALGGTFFGPLVGVTLMLVALNHANVGVVSTIIATQPILIMLYEVLVQGKRVHTLELVGSVLAVGGVVLFFV